MSINNPNKLVEEFKRTGEFDRLRRELLARFQSTKEGLATLKSRVEDVARQRLSNDHNLSYMPQEFIHRELMQELDRFPVVERSTSELPLLDDPVFSTRITNALEKILKDQGITVKKAEQLQDAPTIQDLFTSGGDQGPSQAQTSQAGEPEEASEDAQPPAGSQPAGPDTDYDKKSNKERALTPAPSGKEREQEKGERDPDSMDLDED